MNNIKCVGKDRCCGCTGCYSICPFKAITMKEDKEGFLYPCVDENKCTNCGLCLKVCESKNIINNKQKLFAFAVKNKDRSVLKKSSSGGVSYSLSKYFINKGGIVYGTIYDENHKVIINRLESIEDIEKLYGSKYVQTNPIDTFSQVYNDLKDNKLILYIATSCFIAGLKSFLKFKKVNLDNLYTVDFACHGVPSPKLFDDYIDFLKSKYDFDHFSFRTKERPWGSGSSNYGCTIYLKNGKRIVDSIDARLYLELFFSNYILRPYCHNCNFATVYKPSDITIADFWGLKDAHPSFYDIRGVSAVIIHSDKGKKIFNELNDIIYLKSSVDKIRRKQYNLDKPSPRKEGRDDFWNLYYENGFLYICKRYLNYNFKRKVKFKVKKILMKMKVIER